MNVDAKLTNVRLEKLLQTAKDADPPEGTLVARVHMQGNGASVHAVAADANGAVTLAW